MSNTAILAPKSVARAPRMIVQIEGETLSGLEMVEVNNNNYYQPDTFRVTCSLSKQPANRNITFWASQTDLEIEIFLGVPPDPVNYQPSDLTSFIVGIVDRIDIDPTKGEIAMEGRDYTSLLIETKIFDLFMNKRSSDIAQTFATKHGLSTNIVKTTKQIGTYFNSEYSDLKRGQSEWDILTALAREERCLVFVKGRVLNFIPKANLDNITPYVINLGYDNDGKLISYVGGSLTFSRYLTVAKDVIVYVHSKNLKTKKWFTKIARATHTKDKFATQPLIKVKGGGVAIGKPQTYHFTIQNLTPDQAQAIAYAKLREITQHERRFTAHLPADNILTPTMPIQIQGTNSSLDQTYYPSAVIREMSYGGGYAMQIDAKNHSPENETAL